MKVFSLKKVTVIHFPDQRAQRGGCKALLAPAQQEPRRLGLDVCIS